MKMFRAFIIGGFCLLLGITPLGIAAAAGEGDPHDPNKNKGVPSLRGLALKAVLKKEKKEGRRIPPHSLPRPLEEELDQERRKEEDAHYRLQQTAFKIIAYREGRGALGQFLRSFITENGKMYDFVYIHPNAGFSDMAVGQIYFSLKLRPYKKQVLTGLINAVNYEGPHQPDAENTLFASAGDLARPEDEGFLHWWENH